MREGEGERLAEESLAGIGGAAGAGPRSHPVTKTGKAGAWGTLGPKDEDGYVPPQGSCHLRLDTDP